MHQGTSEMPKTKNGKHCNYVKKIDPVVEKYSGLIDSVVDPHSNIHYLSEAAEVLHGEWQVVFGDVATRASPRDRRTGTRFPILL